MINPVGVSDILEGGPSLTLLSLAGVGCVRRGGAVVVGAEGCGGWCCVAAPVMGMFWTEMPCGVMWWI